MAFENGLGKAFSPVSIIVAIGFVGLSVLLFMPSLTWGFNSDDYWLVPISVSDFLKNPFANYGRPVWTLSYALVPVSPFAQHGLSLVLYAVIGCLLVRLLSLLRASLPATIFMFGFLIHPAAIYSVTWIAQRNDLLVIMFSLLAYTNYCVRTPDTPPHRILVWQVLASASKTPFIFHNLVYVVRFLKEKLCSCRAFARNNGALHLCRICHLLSAKCPKPFF